MCKSFKRYPPNVRETFEANLEFFEFFPAFYVDEDPGDRKPEGLFDYYGVSPYIINNLGPFLSNSLGVYFLCLAFILINALVTEQSDWLDAILYAMKRLLIWSFIISYVLSGYLNFVLYSLTALRWYSFKTKWGSINFCLGVALEIFSLITPFLIIQIIKKYAANKSEETPSNPMEENKKKSTNETKKSKEKSKDNAKREAHENRKKSPQESKTKIVLKTQIIEEI